MAEQRLERVPVVWVVNHAGHDYTKADAFGRVLPITTGKVNPFNPDRLAVQVTERIKVADSEDFVLISGVQILNSIVIAMWLMKFNTVNLLQWSNRDKEYKHLVLVLSNLERLVRSTNRPTVMED